MEGDRRRVNSELWHACAGPKISLPSVGSLVVYFPQGHSEQVAASTLKEVDGQIPNYPNLQSQLVCQLHNVALHADVETDEVFAQMTLQPVNEQEKELFLPPDVGTPNRQPNDFFCKTLTASDTSTHGGFSVPRRAAEKVFPPLDFTKQPPAQELRAKDLHDHVWTFRHIYRGQPKRHLLTTGWSVFVSAKRLVAGDSVLFIRDDKGQLLLGIRRASSRQQAVLPSSVLSSDSMHIGVLAAAAHAAATSSRFQVFYNPRTSRSEFVIPLSKYRKAVHFTQVSVGMRFRMVFETEESTLRRYMGTVTGIGDLDPNRWPGSKWRNLEVGWDESSAGERPRRVSLWEIEPVSTPFLICPPPFALRPKRPSYPGLPGDENDLEGSMKRCLTWLRGENSSGQDVVSSSMQSFGGDSSWIQFQQQSELLKPEIYGSVMAATLPDTRTLDASKVMQQSPLQQGQFQLLQHHMLPSHFLQPQPSPEPQQTHTMWPQATVHPQVSLGQQSQLPPLSLPQQSMALTESQTLPASQSQPISLNQTTSLLFTQPSLPLTQPRPPSPLPQGYLQQQQLVIQPSLPQTQPHVQTALPQQALQCLPQTHHSLPQTHHSTPRMHSSLTQMHPSLPQTNPSLSQTHSSLSQAHKSISQTQVSLPQPQQSLSSQSQHSGVQTQQQPSQAPEVSSHLPQMTFSRSQSSPNLPSIRPLTTFTETDVGFGCQSGGTNSFPFQGILGKPHGSTSGGDDNGQLTSLLRASQSLMQLPQQQKSSVPHPSVVQQQKQLPPQLPPQPQPQPSLQRHNQHAQDAMAPVVPALPQIETQLTGSWFPFSSDGIQCESPLLSNVHIGQSDTSSVVTSCSYSLPPEPLDNTLLVPPTTGSFRMKFGNFNKEVQCHPVNDTVMGPFSSPSGSFTSATPDGGRMSAGLMTSGALEEAVLPRTWSQVPAPVRTFTKVHKSGCVGRSVDLSRLKSYEELRCELARMFNIEGELEDPQRSYWQLVFVDHVGDILLVGDDPWDEFVGCVRAIKILSTAQVLQMNQEALEQLSSLPLQQQTSSSSGDCHVWKDT